MAIRKAITDVLSNLGDSEVDKVYDKLMQAGVQDKSDLEFIERNDLSDILTSIQIRRLLSAWERKNESSFLQEEMPSPQLMSFQELSSSPIRPLLRDEMSSPMALQRRPQISSLQPHPQTPPVASSSSRSSLYALENFELQLETMPADIRKSLRNGKRPDPSARRKFIRLLVDSIQKIKINLDIRECEIIARKMVAAYPQSFQDVTDEGVRLGSGHGSLLRQMKTRIEHVNRNNTLSRLRKPKTPSSNQAEVPSTTVKDSYGCINWQPEALPQDETEESLELKRKELLTIVEKTGFTSAGSSQVSNLMTLTYYLQRQNINNSRAIEDVIDMWPMLFVPRWIYSHFKTLTGISPMERLPESVDQKGPKIREFFVYHNSNKDVRAILNNHEEDSDNAAELVRVLMAHFGEEEQSLFQLVDMTKTPVEVEGEDLPNSPRLILQGRSMATASKWMLAVEGKVVVTSTGTSTAAFTRGLAALFCVYYVFNLEYQEEAAVTLEFIQRCFFKINPDRGSKFTSKKRKSKRSNRQVQRKQEDIHPKVMSLLNNLAEFQVQSSFLM